MNFSDLERDKKLRCGKFSDKQVSDCLSLSKRDIETAKKIVSDNSDWGYNIAYNAMLQATRPLMFSKGYKPTNEWQHITTIPFTQIALGDQFKDKPEFMDRMRRKRHRAVYGIAGFISDKEAVEEIEIAEEFFTKS